MVTASSGDNYGNNRTSGAAASQDNINAPS